MKILKLFILCLTIATLLFILIKPNSILNTSFFNDDIVLLNANRDFSSDVFSNTWDNRFNVYDENETSGSSLYRPIVDISFMIDYYLMTIMGYSPVNTNILIFSIFLTLLFIFTKRYISFKESHVLVLMILFLFIPFYFDQIIYLANRTDTIFFIFILLSMISIAEYILSKSKGQLLIFSVSAILSFLSKETGFILLLIPTIVNVYLVLFKQKSFQTKRIITSTIIVLTITVVYFLLRFFLFGAFIGSSNAEVGIVTSLKNILISYLLIFFTTIDKSVVFYSAMTLIPGFIILLIQAYKIKNNSILVLLSLFGIPLILFGPAIFFSPGQRFTYLSIYAVIIISYYIFYKSKNRKLITVGVILILVSFLPIWYNKLYDINKVEVKKHEIDTWLHSLNIETNYVYLILPYKLKTDAYLFQNGIDQYINNIESFRSKTVLPLFLTKKNKYDYLLSYIIKINGNIIEVDNMNENLDLMLPQLSDYIDKFECDEFKMEVKQRYKNGVKKTVLFISKSNDFNILDGNTKTVY